MPFNGAGVYSPPGTNFPAVANTLILSNDYNTVVNDLATALSGCITKDGQTTVTANIPFGSFRLTGVGSGTARTDAANFGQVQDGAPLVVGTVAGTNSITGLLTPAIAAYATGSIVSVTPANTNTAATTLALNGLSAKNVFCAGAACVGGELRAGVPTLLQYDGTQYNILGPYVGGNLPMGQIKFPSTPNLSANANTLDDYEEGTWTPVIGGTATYTTQVGRYTKIARLTYVMFQLTINAVGTGNNISVFTLPFTGVNAGGGQSLCVCLWASIAVAAVYLVCLIPANSTTIQLWNTGAAAVSLTSNGVHANGSQLCASGVYEAV